LPFDHAHRPQHHQMAHRQFLALQEVIPGYHLKTLDDGRLALAARPAPHLEKPSRPVLSYSAHAPLALSAKALP